MPLRIEQKTTQKQTPATIQLMSMIQMSGLELQNYVERMMQENPVFDIEMPAVYDEGFRAGRRDALKQSADDEHQDYAEQNSTQLLTLCKEVSLQLDSLKAEKPLLNAAKLMASNLDERGYLPEEDFAAIASALGAEMAEKEES